MPNRVALILALLIAAGMAADLVLNGGEGMRYLVQKFLTLLNWVMFWR